MDLITERLIRGGVGSTIYGRHTFFVFFLVMFLLFPLLPVSLGFWIHELSRSFLAGSQLSPSLSLLVISSPQTVDAPVILRSGGEVYTIR